MAPTISMTCQTAALQSSPVARKAEMTAGVVQGTWAMQGLMSPAQVKP